jgi:ABC-type lipoprotein release transport system permease subunit
MALGARPGQILEQFMRQGLRAAGLGLLVGVAATVCVQKWVGTMLYRVRVLDVTTIGAAA